MLQCIKFILQQCVNFISMLFTINVDENLSLGLIMAIVFIFLPVCVHVVTVIKHSVIGDLDMMISEEVSLRPPKKGRGK